MKRVRREEDDDLDIGEPDLRDSEDEIRTPEGGVVEDYDDRRSRYRDANTPIRSTRPSPKTATSKTSGLGANKTLAVLSVVILILSITVVSLLMSFITLTHKVDNITAKVDNINESIKGLIKSNDKSIDDLKNHLDLVITKESESGPVEITKANSSQVSNKSGGSLKLGNKTYAVVPQLG